MVNFPDQALFQEFCTNIIFTQTLFLCVLSPGTSQYTQIAGKIQVLKGKSTLQVYLKNPFSGLAEQSLVGSQKGYEMV